MDANDLSSSLASLDWRPVWITVRVGIASTAISMVAGTALGYALAHWRFPLKRLAMAFVLLPLVLPPTVLGYYLLVIIGRRGFIGRMWEGVFGEPLVFTLHAAVLAACVSTIPIVARQLAAAFSGTSAETAEAARLDGASGFALFARVILPQVRQPMLAAATIAFARAVGDFGATLMVAGNIPGRTQTAAIAIFDLMNSGRENDALVLVVLISVLSLVVLVLTSGSERTEVRG